MLALSFLFVVPLILLLTAGYWPEGYFLSIVPYRTVLFIGCILSVIGAVYMLAHMPARTNPQFVSVRDWIEEIVAFNYANLSERGCRFNKQHIWQMLVSIMRTDAPVTDLPVTEETMLLHPKYK